MHSEVHAKDLVGKQWERQSFAVDFWIARIWIIDIFAPWEKMPPVSVLKQLMEKMPFCY